MKHKFNNPYSNPYLNLKPNQSAIDKEINLGKKMARIFRVPMNREAADLPLLSAFFGSYEAELIRLNTKENSPSLEIIEVALIPAEFIEADREADRATELVVSQTV